MNVAGGKMLERVDAGAVEAFDVRTVRIYVLSLSRDVKTDHGGHLALGDVMCSHASRY